MISVSTTFILKDHEPAKQILVNTKQDRLDIKAKRLTFQMHLEPIIFFVKERQNK